MRQSPLRRLAICAGILAVLAGPAHQIIHAQNDAGSLRVSSQSAWLTVLGRLNVYDLHIEFLWKV